MSEEKSDRIVKLGPDNYPIWQQKVTFLLVTKDLDDAVTEGWLEGGTPTKKAARAKIDKKALAVIGLNIENTQLDKIAGCKTAREAWMALENSYKTKSTAKIMQLSRELMDLKKGSGESLEMYFSRAKSIREQLLMGGHVVEEREVAFRVLTGLPQEYQMVVTVLENSEKTLELDDVMARLLPVEAKIVAQVKVESAYYSGSGSRDNRNQGRECWVCGKKGHFKRNCPVYKERQGNEAACLVREIAL